MTANPRDHYFSSLFAEIAVSKALWKIGFHYIRYKKSLVIPQRCSFLPLYWVLPITPDPPARQDHAMTYPLAHNLLEYRSVSTSLHYATKECVNEGFLYYVVLIALYV